MIYEAAVVLRPETDDQVIKTLKDSVQSVVTDSKGEILLTDDWGVRHFAQATSQGLKQGRYVYFMYKTGTQTNQELERRFRINESVVKNLIVKVGLDKEKEGLVKNYRSPFIPRERDADMELE
ncbi:MAG: 30S ribosomal protein S6 [Bacteriovoracaceae bacterium]|nr:30S ribosomal protein S6 [Bacteriovoracaceae bacterium]